jgi:phosphatidylglycerophosphate synthase
MTERARTPLIGRDASWREIRSALVAAQKSNRNAPAYSRWVNRPLGRVFAATAYRLGLSPNMVSVVSAAFTFTGIAWIALNPLRVGDGLLIAVLLIVGYALDSADGQVARLQGGGSLAGEWLDHVLDAFKNTSFHLAVVVLWLRCATDWDRWTVVIPIAFTLQASVWFFAIILTELLLRAAGLRTSVRAIDEGRQPIVISLLGIPVDYGFLCVAMALLGWFTLWRWLYILLLAAGLVILGVQLVRWYRRVAAADRSPATR